MKRSADFVGLLGRLDRSYGPVPGRERRPVVLVLDNGPIHTSRTSREALALRPWLTVEWLPRYAPDLNGVITQGVQNRPDTVGEVGSSRREGGEARGAGGGARDRPEPGGEALEVDRGRGRHVLQAGPGQPPVAAGAQPEGAHALRDRALDPGPPRVGAPTLLGREAPSGGPERLVFRPRLQPELSGLPGPGAQEPCRAGGAIRLAEPDGDVGRAVPVDPPAPAARRLALRAARPLLVPVDVEPV